MDGVTALEVEAALMDAYPGLSNIAGGTGSSDDGAMHAREIIRRYSAPPADFRHKAILISVNRSAAETSLYEATRYAWKISRRKAMQAEVILATLRGLIVDAFVAEDWLPATPPTSPATRTRLDALHSSGSRPQPSCERSTWGSASRTSTESGAPPTRSSTPGPGKFRRAIGPGRVGAERVFSPNRVGSTPTRSMRRGPRDDRSHLRGRSDAGRDARGSQGACATWPGHSGLGSETRSAECVAGAALPHGAYLAVSRRPERSSRWPRAVAQVVTRRPPVLVGQWGQPREIPSRREVLSCRR